MNYIIPGFALCLILQYLGFEIISHKWYVDIAICYLVGFVNSRVSSLVVEPLSKKIKLVEYAPYAKYLKARELDDKIKSMSDTNNMFRSFVSVFLIGILAYCSMWAFHVSGFHKDDTVFVLLIALLVLFIISYRKQTKYVVRRINYALSNKNEEYAKQYIVTESSQIKEAHNESEKILDK